jgi:hypothetical protein
MKLKYLASGSIHGLSERADDKGQVTITIQCRNNTGVQSSYQRGLKSMLDAELIQYL